MALSMYTSVHCSVGYRNPHCINNLFLWSRQRRLCKWLA